MVAIVAMAIMLFAANVDAGTSHLNPNIHILTHFIFIFQASARALSSSPTLLA